VFLVLDEQNRNISFKTKNLSLYKCTSINWEYFFLQIEKFIHLKIHIKLSLFTSFVWIYYRQDSYDDMVQRYDQKCLEANQDQSYIQNELNYVNQHVAELEKVGIEEYRHLYIKNNKIYFWMGLAIRI
jgi:hypothetical protein